MKEIMKNHSLENANVLPENNIVLCENVVVIHENTKYLCKNNSFAKESNCIYFLFFVRECNIFL